MFVRSFDTKSAPRISRKTLELESPNFIGASIPVPTMLQPYRVQRHYRLPVGSYRGKTVEYLTALGGISRERFNLGS